MIALLVCAVLAGACGKKGDPLPPLRYIPQKATDFAARQQGAEIVLRMPYPKLATNGYALPGLESVEIYRLARPVAADGKAPTIDAREFETTAELLRTLRGGDLKASTVGDRLEVRLPATEVATGTAQSLTFGVRFVATTKERSELSNLSAVIPIAAPPAPTGLALEATPEGVVVSWTGSDAAGSYHVYRRLAAERSYGAALVTVNASESRYSDLTAQFGNRYIYAVTALAKDAAAVESTLAGEREIDYRDRFAPVAPAGLIALTEPTRVRLSWEANGEGDLVGYHVYRKDPGQTSFRRLTTAPVTTTTFAVTDLAAGRVYAFYVAAIDTQGNEGPPSATLEVTLP